MTGHEVDAVVVGAGFAGLYMHHRLRADGWTVRGFEAGSDVGGTWYWNRYPGARCDVDSLEYSYAFDHDLQQEWKWTERYAAQPEILRYLEHVAERFDLRRDIQFDTRVTSATFEEATSRWTIATDRGEVVSCRFFIMAVGCLSNANIPDILGGDEFAGELLHTGQWPHEPVDFTGRRVAVIGTGSSGIQAIPLIAERADQLVVFQRTAPFTVPAGNAPLDPAEQAEIKARYDEFRIANRQRPTAFGSRTPLTGKGALEVSEEEREREYESRWERGGFGFLAAYNDLAIDRDANATAADFVRRKIREIVKDPDVAEKLMPTQVIGCKRLCLDTGYYETFNRPNVQLVDISRSPIEEITPTGIRANGEHHEVDVIVFATGFDAMTGSILGIDIKGRDGMSMREAWHAGPRTYLGLGVPMFPNLFIITGPGSPSVLTNMVVSIEHHVGWIGDCLAYLRDNGYERIEAAEESAENWVNYVNTIANLTLFPTCNSWYLGANIPGKTRVFMPLPGYPPYEVHANNVAATGYDGFVLS
jgi:cation diffusion facilitator CzcD-associated flavoprotein CzcO